MKEMKVGDIGILQNFTENRHHNGTVAEILEGLATRKGVCSNGDVVTILSYVIRTTFECLDGSFRAYIAPHRIRPISDPDAEQSRERKRELVV